MCHTSNHFESLQDNWDDDNAPAPNQEAIIEARKLELWAHIEGLEVELDADVMGGMAVNLKNNDRTIWIAIMNNGSRSVVFDENGKTTACKFTPKLLLTIKAFMLGSKMI